MKRVFVVLFVFLIVLTSCGSDDADNTDKALNSVNDDPGITEQNGDDIEEVSLPQGWDENNYGAYIYDIYDSEFLPDCFPAQIEGTLAFNTTFKDYTHDTLNGAYDVGVINYEGKENYREYGVSFYVTKAQMDGYISALEEKGMLGWMDESEDDSTWSEGFYGGNGWAMYLLFNPNDDHDGEYDGCLSVSATDDLYDRPASIDGIPLPEVGIVTFDYSNYTIQDYSEGYNDVDFDLGADSLPDEYYAAWFDYYCVAKQDAIDYVKNLESNGWAVEYEYSDEEDDYCMVLIRDDIYVIVDYENSVMNVGFSDMIENLSY